MQPILTVDRYLNCKPITKANLSATTILILANPSSSDRNIPHSYTTLVTMGTTPKPTYPIAHLTKSTELENVRGFTYILLSYQTIQ